MDLWNTLQIVLRRWYVVVPMLIATAALTMTVSNGIEPEYHANASVILLGPSGPVATGEEAADQPPAGSDNPYASSLGITATALQLAATGGQTSVDLAAAGLSTDYTISVQSRAPILNLFVDADTPEKAVATARELVRLIGVRLDERETQVGVPIDDRIRVDVLRMSDIGSTDYQAQSRMRILLIVLGVVLSVATAVVVDSVAAALRRRRQPIAEATPDVHQVGPSSTHRALG